MRLVTFLISQNWSEPGDISLPYVFQTAGVLSTIRSLYSQRSYFAFTTGSNISMDGVGYLAAREPLFPLFPALA